MFRSFGTLVLYHTLWRLSRGFLRISVPPLSTGFLLPSPLDTLIIPQSEWFVKRFFTFFFDGSRLHHHKWPIVASRLPTHLLLTIVFYHILEEKASGNVVQLWENKSPEICSTFLLTNSWGYGIMEIWLATANGEPLNRLGCQLHEELVLLSLSRFLCENTQRTDKCVLYVHGWKIRTHRRPPSSIPLVTYWG